MAALPKPIPPSTAKPAEDEPRKVRHTLSRTMSARAKRKREAEEAQEQKNSTQPKGRSAAKPGVKSTKIESRKAALRAARQMAEASFRADARKDETVPAGMDSSWWALGRKLGFLPVWSGLAAVELRGPARGKATDPEGLPDRVRALTSDLMDEGYPFPFVVVPASGPQPDLVREVARAGGQVVEVPETYASLDEVERIALLAQMQPDPRLDGPSEKVGLGIRPSEEPFDESRFRGPSPRLSTRQIEAWAGRLSDPLARPTDLD